MGKGGVGLIRRSMLACGAVSILRGVREKVRAALLRKCCGCAGWGPREGFAVVWGRSAARTLRWRRARWPLGPSPGVSFPAGDCGVAPQPGGGGGAAVQGRADSRQVALPPVRGRGGGAPVQDGVGHRQVVLPPVCGRGGGAPSSKGLTIARLRSCCRCFCCKQRRRAWAKLRFCPPPQWGIGSKQQ